MKQFHHLELLLASEIPHLLSQKSDSYSSSFVKMITNTTKMMIKEDKEGGNLQSFVKRDFTGGDKKMK